MGTSSFLLSADKSSLLDFCGGNEFNHFDLTYQASGTEYLARVSFIMAGLGPSINMSN